MLDREHGETNRHDGSALRWPRLSNSSRTSVSRGRGRAEAPSTWVVSTVGSIHASTRFPLLIVSLQD